MCENPKITVEARPHFIKEQSSPNENRYVFAYTITMRNAGESPLQLHSREWLITDSNGKVQEVHGEGVVGKQPTLNPGDIFRYTSGVIIETPVGIMEGRYVFVKPDGSQFIVVIPQFTLSIPRVLH